MAGRDVSQFVARKKEISSPCLGDNVLGNKKMQIKNAGFKIRPCEGERKERSGESTQLQNWENVIFWVLRNLTPCPKHLDVPVSSVAEWSSSTEMCCQWYGSIAWASRRHWVFVSNKSGGYALVTALARLRGLQAIPLELPELWLDSLTRQERWCFGLWFSMLCTFGRNKNNLCFASKQERKKIF